MNVIKRGLAAGAVAVAALLGAAGATGAEKFPGDVAAVISTKPFAAAVKDVENLTGAILKGTPMQMALMPGMIEAQLLTVQLRLPPDFIDGTRGAHALFLLKKLNEEPAGVLLLPVKDLAAKIESIKALGSTVESPEAGVYQINGDGPEIFLADTGKGYAAYDNKLESVKAAVELLAKWTPPASTATMTITVDVAKLYAADKQTIDGLPALLVAQAEQTAAAQAESTGRKTPAAALAFQKGFAAAGGQFLQQMVSGSDLVTVRIEADANGLRSNGTLAPVAGSDLAKTIAACASFDATAQNKKLLALLPAEEFSVTTMGFPPALMEKLLQSAREISASVVAAGGADVSADEKAMIDDAVKLFELWAGSYGKATVCSYGIGKSGMLNMVSLADVKSGKGAELSAAMLPLLKNLSDKAIAAGGDTGPAKITVESGKVGAVDVIRLGMTMNLGSGDPKGQMVADLITKNYNYTLGIYKDIFIVTMGGEADGEFEAMLKRIDGAASVAAAQPGKDFAAAGNNLVFNAFYLNAFLIQLADLVKPIAAQAQPGMDALIDQFLAGLNAGAPGMTGNLRATSAGLVGSADLPVASVKNAIDEGVKVYMMFAMQQGMQQNNATSKNGAAAKPSKTQEESADE